MAFISPTSLYRARLHRVTLSHLSRALLSQAPQSLLMAQTSPPSQQQLSSSASGGASGGGDSIVSDVVKPCVDGMRGSWPSQRHLPIGSRTHRTQTSGSQNRACHAFSVPLAS